MAKKKQPKKTAARPQLGDSVEILDAGSVLEEPITQTLETNYMPYAMSVIVSRALPEIDGFKPAHRKVLYTMYDMGLLKGKKAVCYPGLEEQLTGAQVPEGARVVRDGLLTTGQAAGSAVEFGLALIEQLAGERKAQEVRHAIHA